MTLSKGDLRRLRSIHQMPGGLHGWHALNGEHTRREALERAIHADGYATVVRRLNLEAIREKNRAPYVTRVAHEDIRWLEERHGRDEMMRGG